jgi:hypothetical protein
MCKCANGMCKWNVQMECANGMCKWNGQMKLANENEQMIYGFEH